MALFAGSWMDISEVELVENRRRRRLVIMCSLRLAMSARQTVYYHYCPSLKTMHVHYNRGIPTIACCLKQNVGETPENMIGTINAHNIIIHAFYTCTTKR